MSVFNYHQRYFVISNEEGRREPAFLPYLTGKDFQQQVQISFSSLLREEVINSDNTLMKWLNATEYHRDKEKLKEIEKFHSILFQGAPRAIFISMLIDKVRAIRNLSIIIRTMQRSDGVPLDI